MTRTSSGWLGTTSTLAHQRGGCATTRMRCDSSRSWSTGRRPGRSPLHWTERSRRRTTRRWTVPQRRSSDTSQPLRPRASARVTGRCRSQSNDSRRRSFGTTRRALATRTDICTCNSMPASSLAASGGDCTRSESSTASRPSTASGTLRSRATPSSARRWQGTGTPLTTPARSSSFARSRRPSAIAPPRSSATSIDTKPPGELTIPERNQARSCGERGTGARGPRADRTRSSLPTAANWSIGGTTSCSISASSHLSTA